MEGESLDYSLFSVSTPSDQQKIAISKLKEKISNSVDYLCDALQHYESLGASGKDFVYEQAADWIISSAFNQFEVLKQIMPTVEQICNAQESFSGSSVALGSLRASYAIQSLYENQDEPIVNFINLEQQQFINFAKPFAQKFSNVNPLYLEQHMAAKARFNQNYGPAFLNKLLENILNKPVCEAIIYFCKWFPANWFFEQREVINQLFEKPELMQYPVLIFAQVLSQNSEFIDLDLLQQYVYYSVEITQENESTMLGPMSELFASQARLFATAAISILSNSQTDSIEVLFQMAQYFFDPERYILKPDVVSQEIVRVLARISVVEPKMVGNICELIVQRVSCHLNYELNTTTPILVNTPAIIELQTLFCQFSLRYKQIVDEFVNNAIQSDQSTILPIFCLLMPISERSHNEMMEFLFNNVFIQYVSEVPAEITNATFPPLVLACKYILNASDDSQIESEIKQYVGNAFQILFIVYSNPEVQWEFGKDPKQKNLHKEEIGKLIIDYDIHSFANPEIIDINFIIECCKLTKSEIKVATSLLSTLGAEVSAQVVSTLIEHAKYEQNPNGDISLDNIYIWLANTASVDNPEISNMIFNFLLSTQSYATNTARWLQAFKCISLKVVITNLENLHDAAGSSTLAHAALFDLLRTAQKASDTIRTRDQETYEDQEVYENAKKFADQNWCYQNIPMIKRWYMEYVLNSLHYPTSSKNFTEVVKVLINNGLEFLKETRNSIQNEAEDALDQLASFIHDSILAERIDCPEIYKVAINCMQTLWAGTNKKIDAIDPDRAVYLCNGTFMYFYSNEFDPNLVAWRRVLEYSMTVQMDFVTGMYKYLVNNSENKDSNFIIKTLSEFLEDKFVQNAMGYIAVRADALQEVLHQRNAKNEYLNELNQAAKPANNNAIPTFKSNITKNIIPLIYQIRQMTFFDQ
ncbi:hypothetical protein TVAG_184870 [Trichomonas vaginalis G3]|uniref:Uncharacterized protein n=1 Tax=Trichomonas vaginalis (strain ATCC PRA-98 / G3) TaxID=412133 RepID=A2D8D2_TRIV3|nr:hypothetical protein TVAGG3_0393990 [Trichomonas vaginalis G3]EAY23181.1 hypothetical protein TVAG_184870 [Trichomonas vaginalis G3]KAI5534196.1 hypothetical protein TVAGG3_0393990 [Trichomonas vaginalis G3]|eukprot:XP_001584167.1 hypothetical protein [Trichomonas vaginalis G3]